MSAALAHPVPTAVQTGTPTAARDGGRSGGLRAAGGVRRRERPARGAPEALADRQPVPADRVPTAGPAPRRPPRRAASARGAACARGCAPGAPSPRARVRAVPAVSGPRPGLLLVPLGEVLVPVGQSPALRPVPGGRALEVTTDGRGRARVAPAHPRAATPPGVTPARASAVRPGPGRRGRTASGRHRSACRRSRGLLVAGLLLLLVAAAARAVAGGASGSAAAAALPAAQRVVVVEQGQTLWSLARELAPGADPRVMVERFRSVNRLEGAGLAVGQRLVVPPAR